MRKLFLAICLFPIASFACPNLSGHFVCKDFESGAVQDVTLAQTEAGGVTTYQMTIVSGGKTDPRTYIADGKVRDAARPNFATRTERAFCDGANLKIEVKGTEKSTGAVTDAIVTVNINGNNNMWDSYVGTEASKAVKFEEVCVRQ